MIDEELLDALASPYFKALRNYGDRWGIAHVSFDVESIGEIFNDDLDTLLQQWIDLNRAIEDYTSGAAS